MSRTMKLTGHTKRFLPAMACMAVAGLTLSCSNDFEPVEFPVTETGVPVWINLSLAAPAGAPTRDGESAAAEPDAESRINTLAVVLTDADGTVKSVGTALPGDIVYDKETGLYSVKVLAGTSITINQKDYNLYVVANAPADGGYTWLSRHIGAATGLTADKVTFTADGSIPASGIPMATVEADKVAVSLTDEGLKNGYPKDDPYMVGGTANRKTVKVHRLWSRVDFTGDTEFAVADTPLTVTFVEARPLTIASEVYLMFNKASDYVNCPAFAAYAGPVEAKPLAAGWSAPSGSTAPYDGTLWYLPENVPAQGEDVTWANTTYVEFTALLGADASKSGLSPEIAGYIGGETDDNGTHPDLWYYDDGVFQSPLTVDANRNTTSNPANWHRVQWDNTRKGYTVTYVRALRNNVEGSSADDGVITPMEYGLVRNTIYRISVNSVRLMPRPFKEDDPVEKYNDLNITVTTPGEWTYHGTGSKI